MTVVGEVRDAEAITSLGEAARVFFSRRGPRMIVATAAASWARRALAGPMTTGDIVTAALVAASWPFQEWAAHRWLLHHAPGERWDPYFARAHRTHHRNPAAIDATLLPVRALKQAIPGSLVAFRLLLRDRRARQTAMATYATVALVYEWTHFLVHTGYRPRSRLFKRVRRNHRLHHYHNEGYWFGFTVPHVDAWLGTDPDPRATPRSPTVRRLFGHDDDVAGEGSRP